MLASFVYDDAGHFERLLQEEGMGGNEARTRDLKDKLDEMEKVIKGEEQTKVDRAEK